MNRVIVFNGKQHELSQSNSFKIKRLLCPDKSVLTITIARSLAGLESQIRKRKLQQVNFWQRNCYLDIRPNFKYQAIRWAAKHNELISHSYLIGSNFESLFKIFD